MEILFVCKFNVGRSQIAETFFNKFSRRNHAISAGINPYYIRKYGTKISEIPNEPAVEVMAKKGIDISKNKIKILNKKMIRKSDLIVVLMTKKRANRDLPKYVLNSEKLRFWEIKNVSGRQTHLSMYKAHCKNRDKIQLLVKRLVGELDKK
jgi:arsenate reductase